jgi:hypothetical protein
MTPLVVLALAAALLALTGCGGRGSLDVSLIADSAEGLSVGTPVEVSGTPVGRVTDISLLEGGQVELKLAIDHEYRNNVTTDARFTLARAPQDAGQAVTAVTIAPGSGDPAPEGTIFELRRSWRERLSDWSRETYGKIAGRDVERDLERFHELADQAAERGTEEWERVRPELERLARDIGESLEEAGSESAERIERELERIIEERGDRKNQ